MDICKTLLTTALVNPVEYCKASGTMTLWNKRWPFAEYDHSTWGRRNVLQTPWPITQEINPLTAELNPIYHLLALLGAHHILHVNRIRVNFALT